jgi:hypothetical protein
MSAGVERGCYTDHVQPPDLRERLLTAVELWRAGVLLRRQQLRRAHPDAKAEEIEALLNDWLQQRPGAEMGDGPAPPADDDSE